MNSEPKVDERRILEFIARNARSQFTCKYARLVRG